MLSASPVQLSLSLCLLPPPPLSSSPVVSSTSLLSNRMAYPEHSSKRARMDTASHTSDANLAAITAMYAASYAANSSMAYGNSYSMQAAPSPSMSPPPFSSASSSFAASSSPTAVTASPPAATAAAAAAAAAPPAWIDEVPAFLDSLNADEPTVRRRQQAGSKRARTRVQRCLFDRSLHHGMAVACPRLVRWCSDSG